MKKLILIGLPVLAALLIVGGNVFSQPEPEESDSIHRHFEGFARGGYRLGVVLDERTEGDGVAIAEVHRNSPADKAGFREGDVIVKIDGKQVENPKDIRETLRNLGEQRQIDVEVLRDGKPMTLTVTPEKRSLMSHFRMGRRFIGVNVQELDSDLASYFKVDPGAGLLITRVEPNGPAAEAGIRSGDILTHIDGKKVTDSRSVSDLIEEGNSESVEVTVLRNGNEMKMVITPGNREMFDPSEMQRFREFPQMFNSPEFQSEMESLKNELKDLKLDLEGIRTEHLESLREEIQRELKQEMDKLRNELKEKKNEM
jgi:C-terminal processing protease CtpA/Prc